MGYLGDAYDTPPVVIRVITSAVCLLGAIIVLYYMIPGEFGVPAIITCGGLLMAVFLIWTVPRGGQTALVTMAYWTLLIYYVLFLPLGV